MNLPPELRNRVYELMFTDKHRDGVAIPLVLHRESLRLRLKGVFRPKTRKVSSLAMLSVNKQVRREAEDYLWWDAHAELHAFEDCFVNDPYRLNIAIDRDWIRTSIETPRMDPGMRLQHIRRLSLTGIDALYWLMCGDLQSVGSHWRGGATWFRDELKAFGSSLAQARRLLPSLGVIEVYDTNFDDLYHPREPEYSWFKLLFSLASMPPTTLKASFPNLSRLILIGGEASEEYVSCKGDYCWRRSQTVG
jgi:hypothetical protein